MTGLSDTPAPILANKHHSEASAFQPGNLLREARRQKGLALRDMPAICLLDHDGDLVRRLRRDGRAAPEPDWACYHSELDCFVEGGVEFGIVGCAVGASYAVLVAEQLFASGCRLLISMTSSGRLQPVRAAALLHSDRPGPARRGHELPLPAAIGLRRGRRRRHRRAGRGLRRAARAGAARRDLDDRCALPRDGARHRCDDRARPARRRDGSRRALCLRSGLRPPRRLLRPCHEPDGQEGDFEKGEADGTIDALAVIAAAARRLG